MRTMHIDEQGERNLVQSSFYVLKVSSTSRVHVRSQQDFDKGIIGQPYIDANVILVRLVPALDPSGNRTMDASHEEIDIEIKVVAHTFTEAGSRLELKCKATLQANTDYLLIPFTTGAHIQNPVDLDSVSESDYELMTNTEKLRRQLFTDKRNTVPTQKLLDICAELFKRIDQDMDGLISLGDLHLWRNSMEFNQLLEWDWRKIYGNRPQLLWN